MHILLHFTIKIHQHTNTAFQIFLEILFYNWPYKRNIKFITIYILISEYDQSISNGKLLIFQSISSISNGKVFIFQSISCFSSGKLSVFKSISSMSNCNILVFQSILSISNDMLSETVLNNFQECYFGSVLLWLAYSIS